MEKLREAFKKRGLEFLVVLMVIIVVFIALAPSILKLVPPGHVGVLYRTLGDGTETDIDQLRSEGLNFIWPWDQLDTYDTRIQEKTSVIRVITKGGLSVDVEVSVRFHLNVRTIGLLHKYIGPDYIEKVVVPEIEATTRDVIGLIDVDSLYSDGRVAIQDSISSIALSKINKSSSLDNEMVISKKYDLDNDFRQRGSEDKQTEQFIIFENLFLRDIALPEGLANKIEEKMVAEQEYRRYQYLIAAESQEKARRMIEAEGVKEFEEISGISILKWRGIQATEALANSKNAKVIVLGTDENLPIILNGEQ